MSINAIRTGTKVTTGLVRLNYIHVFEPYSIEEIEGYEARYSTTVIISKGDTETVKAINESIAIAKKELKCKGNIKTPLRDGDLERPGDPLYKDCYFLNANSKNKPGVVDANINPIVGPMEVKNGCYTRVSFNLYSYNSNGNKGIAAGLGNIQIIGGAK